MTLKVIFIVGFIAIVVAEPSEKPSGKFDSSSRSARQISLSGCPYGDFEGSGRYANSEPANGKFGEASIGRGIGPNVYGRLPDNRLDQGYIGPSWSTQNGPDGQRRFDSAGPSSFSLDGGSQRSSIDRQGVNAFPTSNGSPGRNGFQPRNELEMPNSFSAANECQARNGLQMPNGFSAPNGMQTRNGLRTSNGGQGPDEFQRIDGNGPSFGGSNPSSGGVNPISPSTGGVNPSVGGIDSSSNDVGSSFSRIDPSSSDGSPSFDGIYPSLNGVNPSVGGSMFRGVNLSAGGVNQLPGGVRPIFPVNPLFGGGTASSNRGWNSRWWLGTRGATTVSPSGAGSSNVNVIGGSPNRNIGPQGVPIYPRMQTGSGDRLGGSVKKSGSGVDGGLGDYRSLLRGVSPQYVSPSGLPRSLDGSRYFADCGNPFGEQVRSSPPVNYPWLYNRRLGGFATQPQNHPVLLSDPSTNRPNDAGVNWRFPYGTPVLDTTEYGQAPWGAPAISSRWRNLLNALRIGRTGFRILAHAMHKLANRT